MTKLQLEWTDALLTGDREIDNQHKTFFLYAQRIVVACGLLRGPVELEKTVHFMTDYAATHFAAEEERMGTVQYPYIETHKAAHRSFLNRLEDLTTALENAENKHALAQEAANMATDWFIRHIRLVDRPFIDALREQKE